MAHPAPAFSGLRVAPQTAKGFILLLASWVAMGSSAPSAGPTVSQPLDPYNIYARCVKAMRENATPAYMTYVLNVDADHIDLSRSFDPAGEPMTTLHFRISHHKNAYRVWYRGKDQKSLMQDLGGSRTLAVVPPVPWALDFHARAEVDPPPTESSTSGSVTTNQEGALLREISTDQSRYYRITFAGMENSDNQPTYHLLLENRSGNPNEHALRELFVDAASFRPRTVVMEVSQHTLLYGGRLQLRATFAPVGPYWLNTEGAIEGRGYYTIFFLNGSYTYTAKEFLFPSHLPNSYFQGSAGS